jgi:uncharacterized protein YecE (DUF72 family)
MLLLTILHYHKVHTCTWLCILSFLARIFTKKDMDKKIHIGMSGWSYWDWKKIFYPEKMKSTDWLGVYAQSYNTTEINSSFYHLPKAKTISGWAAKVPENFKFCPKISRYLTHILKLKNPEEPLQLFFEVFEPIEHMLGPVLIQLPPSLKYEPAVVEAFFEILKHKYNKYKFAIEARHITWLEKEPIKLMKKFNVAWVISQSGVGFPYLEEITADNIYVRFHGPGKLYASSYPDQMLRAYSVKFKKWIKEGHSIWAYFNNTYQGIALNNANTLKEMMGID